ncbi:hypothetical protein Metin_0563 [Methanocaldococcus infernus ME]|uniref:Uncharacterized protein n=2 Tax=Methanocaldococcus infernus TaxID=67760 RepID=D5VRN0_METIM|nr:hypothetical protein Metin_0563 [Methanocaldococcus infernus ME]
MSYSIIIQFVIFGDAMKVLVVCKYKYNNLGIALSDYDFVLFCDLCSNDPSVLMKLSLLFEEFEVCDINLPSCPICNSSIMLSQEEKGDEVFEKIKKACPEKIVIESNI